MDTFIAQLPLLLGMPEATGAAGTAGSGGQLVSLLVTFGLIIVIFYFLIIRPQSKKQKDTQKMLSALKRGDKVVTIGGMRGTIHSVKEETVLLKVDDEVKLEFSRSAIASVLSQAEGESASAAAAKSNRKGKGADKPAENGATAAEKDGESAASGDGSSDAGGAN